ncbi:MAG: hypothetical protein ACI9RZ_000031 [Sphingobacteriales bacterium]
MEPSAISRQPKLDNSKLEARWQTAFLQAKKIPTGVGIIIQTELV